MNVYDSARMADVVAPLGYAPSDIAEDADLVILNTCHIREKATEKLFSELGRVKEWRDTKNARGEQMMVAVAGCVAQAEGSEIQRRAPYVDMVFGPQTYHQLPEMIARISRGSGAILNTDFPAEPKFDLLPQNNSGAVSGFLSIQEGCDKFCTFCVVPYTRGAEYSRTPQAIIDEAKRMVEAGAREISVLGQNVNAYHGSDADGKTWNLARLLRGLAEIPNLLRLRYTTSHPRDMDDELIAAHRDITQLMPLLHLPVQSGSDAMLEAMNRKHTADDYKRTLDKLRAARPEIAFSSDFIIGFPGETDKDFEATMQLARDVGFAQAYSFKYSRRPGTPAAAMTNQIAENVKDARLKEFQELLGAQQKSFNRATVDKTMPVLFEKMAREDGFLFGRTPYAQTTLVKGNERLVGQEMNVVITEGGPNSLVGELPALNAQH